MIVKQIALWIMLGIIVSCSMCNRAPTTILTPSLTPSVPVPSNTDLLEVTTDWNYQFPPTVTVAYYLPTTPTPGVMISTVTATQASAAICPPAGKSDVDLIIGPSQINFKEGMEGPILDYLNQGGSASDIQNKLDEALEQYRMDWVDLTNDGLPDLILQYGGIYVFTCNQGSYQTALVVKPIDYGPGMEIVDANQNGIPDLIVHNSFGGMMPIYQYKILEWDGAKFHNLLADETLDNRYCLDAYIDKGVPEVRGGFGKLMDIDEDGMLEFVITGGRGIGGDEMVYDPQRDLTMIWKWDGQAFHLSKIYLSPPHYRIQALQDGDEYSLAGDYQSALASYWRVINDESLDWWGPSRRAYKMTSFESLTPQPTPLIDKNEYLRLAAYAYYRISLIHILEGDVDRARKTYDQLMTTITESGQSFKVLATVFWNEYERTHQINRGCQRVIDYVNNHPEDTIEKLGSETYFIISNHRYVPEDLCPF